MSLKGKLYNPGLRRLSSEVSPQNMVLSCSEGGKYIDRDSTWNDDFYVVNDELMKLLIMILDTYGVLIDSY
jgi:hypothetical protein